MHAEQIIATPPDIDHIKMINYIIDTRTPLEDRIALIKFNEKAQDDYDLKGFTYRCGMILCGCYVRWQQALGAEQYERCKAYRAFVKEFKILFRHAVRTYPFWTLDHWNAMEDTNAALQRKFFQQ